MDPEVQDSDKPASSVPPTVAPGAVPLRPYTPRPVPRSVPASLVPARKWSRPEAVLRCAGRYSPELPEGADWCELQELRRAQRRNRHRYRWPGTTVCTRCLGCVCDPGVGIGICQRNIRGSRSPWSNGVSPPQPPVPGGRGGCLPGGSDRQGSCCQLARVTAGPATCAATKYMACRSRLPRARSCWARAGCLSCCLARLPGVRDDLTARAWPLSPMPQRSARCLPPAGCVRWRVFAGSGSRRGRLRFGQGDGAAAGLGLAAMARYVPGRGLERQLPRVTPVVLAAAGRHLTGPDLDQPGGRVSADAQPGGPGRGGAPGR